MRSSLPLLMALALGGMLQAQTSTVVIGSVGSSGNSGGMATPVLNLPCTVELLTTHTRTLADGTHITNTDRHVTMRDSQGRTRQEMYFPRVADRGDERLMSIVIYDPADHRMLLLRPQNKTATVLTQPEPRRPAAPPGNQAAAASARFGAPQQNPSQRSPLRAESHSESLPGQTFNGIYAVGRRTTMTLPVGFEGNDQPLVMTTDRYTSPDLQIEVYGKVEDPQSGESITEIKRLDREEPDPSLFKVPEGYTLEDNRPLKP